MCWGSNTGKQAGDSERCTQLSPEGSGKFRFLLREGLLESRHRAGCWGRHEEQQPRPCPVDVTATVKWQCEHGEIDPVGEAKQFSLAFRTKCICPGKRPVTMLIYLGLYFLPVLQYSLTQVFLSCGLQPWEWHSGRWALCPAQMCCLGVPGQGLGGERLACHLSWPHGSWC